MVNGRRRGGRGVKPLEQGLRIKAVLFEHGVKYVDLAEAVGISKSAMTALINKNVWPMRFPQEETKARIKAVLRAREVPENALGGLWEWGDGAALEERREFAPAQKRITRIMEARMLDQGCINHFGLSKNPFPKRIAKADEYWWTPAFKRSFDSVLKAIEDREFACIVGESGSGKTTLRLMIEQHLRANPRVKFVAPFDLERERMRPHAMAEALIRDLDPGRQKMPQSRENKYRVARQMLLNHAQQGVNVVLQIEEAHGMTNESLKSLKRILEFGGGFDSVVTVLLWAQPEIMTEKFSYSNISLREVALRCMMIPLPGIFQQTEKYLAWKLEKAGGSLDATFTPDALKAMKKRLKPNERAPLIDTPLQIHALASNAMMKAYETSEAKVTAEVVNALDRWWFTT